MRQYFTDTMTNRCGVILAAATVFFVLVNRPNLTSPVREVSSPLTYAAAAAAAAAAAVVVVGGGGGGGGVHPGVVLRECCLRLEARQTNGH